MSGVWIVCVCRLRAPASNCELLIPFIVASRAPCSSGAMFGFLCGLPRLGMLALVVPFLLCDRQGCKGDLESILVSRTCLDIFSWLSWYTGACSSSRMRNTKRACWSLASERSKLSLDTDDNCGCNELWPKGFSFVRLATSRRNATWLILPVVICLSQRLSHACVSMN